MGDKARAPRLREQYKDNAVEVSKNAEFKESVHTHFVQHKEAEIREQEEDDNCQD